jgi:hypothetical protein
VHPARELDNGTASVTKGLDTQLNEGYHNVTKLNLEPAKYVNNMTAIVGISSVTQ